MADQIDPLRRLFSTAAITLAASQLAFAGSAEGQPAKSKPGGSRYARPGPNTSFVSLKQVDAGVLDVGYAEAGPADGLVVILLHGWPYDIYSFIDVTPLLASAGYRVIVPYLRGYGTTRFLSDATARSGQPSALAVDVIAFMDALKIEKATLAGFDWGARTANIVAALWPERCKAMVSVSGYLIGNQQAGKTPLPPEAELQWWYQFYFATERGRAGYEKYRQDFSKLIWRLASPQWHFDETTFERSATAFDNPDHVAIVVHNYRWRLGLAEGEPRYDDLEKRLAQSPSITVPTITMATDQAAGFAGMKLVKRPEPQPAINDVIVEVHASGFVPTELEWPSTWTDRREQDRTPSIPGHEFAGIVTAVGYGTTGLSVGQRVFGLADWYRDGTLAEYIAIEARNLAPLPGDVDFMVGASLPISGLTAWQGLFQHGRLQAGQSVLAHGAAGAVGSIVVQLAREAGAYVIGTGRAADRQKALDFGANEFVDLEKDALKDVGGVDLAFDVIGGDIQKQSAALVRAGGTLVSVVGPAQARPLDGLAIDFVVEADRGQLSEIVQRVRDGRLRTNIGKVSSLDDAVATFNSAQRRQGKTIIQVRSWAGRGSPQRVIVPPVDPAEWTRSSVCFGQTRQNSR